MEFFGELAKMFSPEVVNFLLIAVFVVLIYAVLKVATAFAATERGKALQAFWEQIDEYAEAAITTVATTEQERESAKLLAAEYSLKLGQAIDWRMALVLKKLEDYSEKYVPFDLDLIEIYARAEHVYFQVQEALNAHERKDLEQTENE